ncbi:hypothetical protein Tco_0218511 [Tanacetum coccineum]
MDGGLGSLLSFSQRLAFSLERAPRIILVIVPEHPSDSYVLTMKMEIMLEPASNKLLTRAEHLKGNPLSDCSLNDLEMLKVINT